MAFEIFSIGIGQRPIWKILSHRNRLRS